jgi:hypothetical protein
MYNSLSISSNTSVDERDIVSTVAGPTIIVIPGVNDGKYVANTVDLVNGVHGTKKKKNNIKKKKKKMKDMMIASMPSTANISIYMSLDSRCWCQYLTLPVILYLCCCHSTNIQLLMQ